MFVYIICVLAFQSETQLTELIDSHSRSSELVRIMNKFGVGMPCDTMSCDIVKAIF